MELFSFGVLLADFFLLSTPREWMNTKLLLARDTDLIILWLIGGQEGTEKESGFMYILHNDAMFKIQFLHILIYWEE